MDMKFQGTIEDIERIYLEDDAEFDSIESKIEDDLGVDWAKKVALGLHLGKSYQDLPDLIVGDYIKGDYLVLTEEEKEDLEKRQAQSLANYYFMESPEQVRPFINFLDLKKACLTVLENTESDYSYQTVCGKSLFICAK